MDCWYTGSGLTKAPVRPATARASAPNPTGKVVHAVLAQQRVHVRGGQAGPAKFTILYLALGHKNSGRMVNDAGHPVVPSGERDEAVCDQEGDQRDCAGGKRCRRRGHGPADDRADRDGDREVERGELGERTPLSKPQADDGHREHQHRLDRHPAETTRPADQFQQPLHPFWLVACPACCSDVYRVRNSPIAVAISSAWVSRAK